jgi:hypothetical protein
MLILKIIVTITVFLIPIVILLRDWKFDDKRTPLYGRITSTVLFASFALIIPSALFLYFDIREASRTQQEMKDSQESLIRRADEQAEDQRQLRDKSDQIAALYQKIAQAQGELAQSQRELRANAEEQANAQRQLRKKSDEIAALNNLLAAKSDEIANLNREIAAKVMGGDSYCYLDVAKQGKFASIANPDIVELILIREGSYPIYDVLITIEDLGRGIKNAQQHNNREELKNYLSMLYSERHRVLSPIVTQISVGNIGIRQVSPYWLPQKVYGVQPIQLKITGEDQQSYAINIAARNGRVNQTLLFRRVYGVWKKAVQVSFNGKTVKESIDRDFPRDDYGQVQWFSWLK